jgi:hypothetical protein
MKTLHRWLLTGDVFVRVAIRHGQAGADRCR